MCQVSRHHLLYSLSSFVCTATWPEPANLLFTKASDDHCCHVCLYCLSAGMMHGATARRLPSLLSSTPLMHLPPPAPRPSTCHEHWQAMV